MTATPALSMIGLLRQAEAAFARGEHGETEALALQVLAAKPLTPSRAAKAAHLRLSALYRQGRLADVVEHLADGLRRTAGPPHRALRLELLRMGSLACGEVGRYEEALRHAHDATMLAGDDVVQRVFALNAQASCFERMGDPWQASRLMVSALELAQSAEARASHDEAELAYPRLLTQNNLCATQLGMFHILRDAGAPDEARRVLATALASAQAALPMARARGDAWPQVFVLGNMAEAQVHLGQPDAALQTLADALPQALGHGFHAQTWALRCTRAEACIALKRIDEALRDLQGVMQEIAVQQPVAVMVRLHHALYCAHEQQGDVARALHHLEQYLGLQRERTSRQLQAQSRVLVTRLEMEQARQQAERARHEARQLRRRADHWADAALHDALTGLLNRRGLEARLAAWGVPTGALAVAMVDVDHFKQINDGHGHAVGDVVLERLAKLLRSGVRPSDVLGRLGGEEFTLLMLGLDERAAREVCERLRVSIEQDDWTACGLPAGERVTVSIGLMAVASQQLTHWPCELSTLVMPADDALYRAKRRGRNCVEVATAASGDGPSRNA